MLFFTDGSDLNGITKVEDIVYLKKLRSLSRFIDGWAKDTLHPSQIYRRCVIGMLILSLISQVIYLRNKFGTASTFDLGHQYLSILIAIMSIIRGVFVLTDKYNESVHYFINELHLFNYKDMSSHANEIHIAIHKLCHFYTTFTTRIAVITCFLFNLRPIVNNFYKALFSSSELKNLTFNTTISLALPIDYETNLLNYVVVTIYNWYISIACILYFVIIDTLLSLMIFQIWGHIKILCKNLELIPKPTIKSALIYKNRIDAIQYSEEESEEVLNQLKHCIKHHNLIIVFLSKMMEVFGFILLVYYTFFQVAGCLFLLLCSPMDSGSLSTYGPTTIYLFLQLIQSSIIFELLNSSNDALTAAIYNIPWECTEIKHRKLMIVMMRMAQRPLNLRPMNMMTVGVQTMISIIKTSISYFLMIKTFAEL